MVNINLSSAEAPQGDKINWGRMLPIEIAILVIVSGIGGYLLLDQHSTDKKIATTKAEYKEKEEVLKGETAKTVFDFHNRMGEANKLLDLKNSAPELLAELEKTVVGDVYISTMEFNEEKRTVKLSCIAKNFNQVAEQILSFKKSTLFSQVAGGDSEILERDKIRFNVNLTLK